MVQILQLAVLLPLVSSLVFAARTDFKFVEYMTVDGFETFKESPEIRVAYFYKREVSRLASFYREYERSAELLLAYHVKCAVVDCTKPHSAEYCEKKKAEHFVFAFRDGYELLQLELETMFDVNSIMSNILQLVLLRDVPIVQTEEELAELEESVQGQHDLIFSYHRAIGTYEHRLYMDVAYAYQSKYKFGLTTEKSTVSFLPGANDDPDALCMIWALSCRTTTKSSRGITHCPSVKFLGKLDMVDVATFVRALALPSVYHVPEDGISVPYADLMMHLLHVYHDNQGQMEAYEMAQNLSATYRGMVGIVTVNVETESLPEELQYEGTLLAAKLKLKNINDDRFISGHLDVDSVRNFVKDALNDFKHGVQKDNMDGSQMSKQSYADKLDDIEEVQQLDDPVSKAVYELRHKTLPLEHIPALTDKTFPTSLAQNNLLLVLFYLKVDSSSTAFLHAYAEAGASFTSPDDSHLARVDCSDWTDVCQQQNITMYPTVLLFNKGERQMVYNGHLGKDSIVSAINLYQLDGFVKPVSKEEAKLFSDGLFPKDLRQSTPVSVLGLLEKQSDVQQLRAVAAEYQHKAVFGLVTDQALGKQIAAEYGVTPPCILLFKRNDPLKPVEIFKKEMVAKKIAMFVSYASIPRFGELLPANLPQIYLQFRPLLVVFVGSEDTGVLEVIEKVAVADKFPWAMFSWMNVSGVDSLGSRLLYHYTKQPKIPHVTLVIRHKAEVYNYPEVDISVNKINKWLDDIRTEKVSPSMNLPRGIWQPKHEGFDFLRMIDEGIQDSFTEEDDVANLEGIGFDADGHYSVGMTEEEQQLSQSVDEHFHDQSEDSEDEADSLQRSRLSGHHRRSGPGDKPQKPTTQQTPTTTRPDPTTPENPDVNTHDGGEL